MPSRGKYLGFVAHELKNPLATALWSCDLLKRMEGPDRTGERADKMIDVSLRALRRMRRLIDDFFTIERLLEHGYELRREPLEVKALVDAALESLAEKDGYETAGWEVQVGPLSTTGDVEMLKRAVRLAIEHMARASQKPRLSIRSDGRALLIRADVPPSPVIPPAPEERPSGDPAGAVLGFALAETILEMHRGRVEERDGALALAFGAGTR
jgi:signal transduction histidine kinase